MRKLISLLFCTFILFSCTSRNKLNDAGSETTRNDDPKTKENSKAIADRITFFEKVLIGPKFSQIKMSGKMMVETGAPIPALNTTIYIEQNQKIWMNLTAVFLNVSRGIATAEGIKAKNNFEKTYIDSDFEYLNNLLNVNFIDYKALENILIGRTFIKLNDSQFQLTKSDQGFKMASLVNQKIVKEEKTTEYKVILFYANNYDLSKVQIRDVNSPDELEISYTNWEAFNEMRLPKNVKIILKGTKNGEILLENTNFESSKMATPYSVPNNYTKIEIR